MKKIFIFLFLLSACKRDVPVPDPLISIPIVFPSAYKTKNVFIVIMDGARYSETWGESSQQYIPHIKQLSPTGVIGTNFYNDGETVTISGHTAITTGIYQVINNGGMEIPTHVSLFQLYLSKFSKPASDAWIISTKDKLEVLSDCTNPYWSGKFKPRTDCGINGNTTGYREDSVTYQHVIDTIKMYHPHLVLVNFKHPDATAHANNWPDYLTQIKNVDRYIGQLWSYLQSDSLYAGTTTMFVTNDHGRQLDSIADGFVSHGYGCEGCRHIMFLALGPDFKTNYIETKRHSLVDIYATTCKLFGIKAPANNGKVMNTILR